LQPLLPDLELNDMTVPPGESGTWAFMYRGLGLTQVKERYQRDDIAFKVHHPPIRDGEDLNDYIWGAHYIPKDQQTTLLESLRIQNLCAIHGLAPRVYGVEIWQDQYGVRRPVQVTEDMGRSNWSLPYTEAKNIHRQLRELGEAHGFSVPGIDKGVQNVAGNKWVDFQAFRFEDDYFDRLLERFWSGTMWGDRPYQMPLEVSVQIDTCRDIMFRIKDLGLDDLDFTPHAILDIGCSGGAFLNYLTHMHKARGTGYDTFQAIQAAQEYSAYMEAWNIDYHVTDLKKTDAITGQYDLVLFMSMSRHVGLPDYVKHCASKRLILEVHSEHDNQVEDWLGDEFKITKRQRSSDYGRLVMHVERGMPNDY